MPRTSRDRTVYPITVRELQVIDAYDLSPGMRRVVLGGPGVHAHERNGVAVPALVSNGFDDDVKIIVPDPATGEAVTPEPLPDGRLDWDERTISLARTYTVRSFDTETGQLVVDFAQHIAGLASTWAGRARPGQAVHVAGPKASSALPTHADSLLIAGDETALPAIARCLEELPAGFPVQAVVEVAETDHIVQLATQADARITWVVRAEGGDFIRTTQECTLDEGTPYVWIAGEAGRIKPLRRWFTHDCGLPKSDVEITGYWKERPVVTMGDDPSTVDVEATGPRPTAVIHEMTELAPAFAVRAACEIDLFAAIDEGVDNLPDLAGRTGVPAERLSRLVRYLGALEYLRLDDEGFLHLTPLGNELSDPDSHMVTSLTGAAARRDLAFIGLLAGLRTGERASQGGQTIFAELTGDGEIADDHADRVAQEAGFTAPALPPVLDLKDGEQVTVLGPGAGVYADEIIRQRPDLSITVTGDDRQLRRCRDEMSAARRPAVTFTAAPRPGQLPAPADTVVAVDLPGTTPAEDLPALISDLLSDTGRLVMVTPLLDPARPDEHELEDDLRRLCLHGAALPTRSDLEALAAVTGTTLTGLDPVGWGQHAVTFRAGPESS
ncbi:NADPH-dependent ferric siderophore reductase, contains FAD-binding and SIP domains [Austwickia chelonae]|uniref:Putative siderophore-interacting protein n=1 Tax=Austwickia chelonae NBRC 105200 TaxID=1184607 RepID=K6UMX2_9MICO|nr:siderophore-interacting protein [Austwickia chelonae]GAB78481.1 putative siderophore-interacting protein [Austwickia chelonae NBRC 105200]SEW39993.1 NADPH-dependent ferric siderophore reductase, contains FAD-binding and SIP domains [Austwickia chelonae]